MKEGENTKVLEFDGRRKDDNLHRYEEVRTYLEVRWS